MSTLIFHCAFLSNASPAVVLTSTELTGGAAPTINIATVAIADGTTIASVVGGGAMVYNSYTKTWSYRLASADLATYSYVAMATTTYATASPASVHCQGIVIPDELISTRHASGAAVAKSPATLAAADVSGNLPANLAAVLGTALSEGAVGRLAAAVVKFFDKASPTGTVNSLPDAVPGAVNGLSILDDDLVSNANVKNWLGNPVINDFDTLSARLGAWTGTGLNTVLGALRALVGKAPALTPTDISTGTTFDNTKHSLEAIRDAMALEATLTAIKGAGWTTETLVAIDVLIDAIKAKTDLLTSATAAPVATPIIGSAITITIGATLALSGANAITGLTIAAAWTAMDFTLKENADRADDAAILRIRVSNPAAGTTDGVLRVEGAAASVAQRTLGGLTVTQAAGTVAIAATAALTAALASQASLVWDLKEYTAAAQTIRGTGTAIVQHTPTWAVT